LVTARDKADVLLPTALDVPWALLNELAKTCTVAVGVEGEITKPGSVAVRVAV
jgi:hypothetical protein